jgi:single-strand DNA-binding protein
MLNRVTLIGNLGKDPDVRRLENGAVVAKFSVATNEYYRDKNGELQQLTEWHDVVAWRALAEQAEKILRKGRLVYVEGRLSHRKWQDRDGNDRYATEVLASMLKILDRKDTNERGGGYGENFPSTAAEPPRNVSGYTGSTGSVPPPRMPEEEDLPF